MKNTSCGIEDCLNVNRRTVLGALGVTGVTATLSSLSQNAHALPEEMDGENTMNEKPMTVSLLIYEHMNQLDATGPFEVFVSAGLQVNVIAQFKTPVTAFGGLQFLPAYDFSDAPPCDILCVPGGGGVNPLLTDEATIRFIRDAAHHAEYVTSVCTGSLLLGAAGLLQGKRATTHWASMAFLEPFGAIPIRERTVKDGNVITGGGVTAGIDFAFAVLDEALGRDSAELTMLALEYDPEPPFSGGTPQSVRPEIKAQYDKLASPFLDARQEQVIRAASRNWD